MDSHSDSNKRLAKNTGLLYIRMFVIMAVSLFTSRVVLKTLGVEDFGIYNVVGGVVAMMGVFNQSLAASIQRYLSYGIGKGDALHLNKVFSVCINLYVLLSVILIVLAETIGLWFLNHKMQIPVDRMFAANVVYQFSIFTCIATLVTNVYNAVIISHEKMNFYAYVSIVEVALKLGIVYILIAIGFDKLIFYAILMFGVSVLIWIVYFWYCRRNFAETRYRYYRERDLFRELFAFSGWNLFGVISGLLKTQGLNVLLNMFFSPVVNASRGIAVQVNGAVAQFFNNFFTAVRPQITIAYAQGEIGRFLKLITQSSKFSMYLILFISLPILIEAPYIIGVWLGQEPEYVVSFTRLIILITAVDSVANPLMTAAQATGRIKLYQSTVGTMIMLNIPVSYLFLKLGFMPDTVFVISLIISVICLFMRVWVVKYLVPEFDSWSYISNAVVKTFAVCVVAALAPVAVWLFMDGGFMQFLTVSLTSLLSTALVCFYLGMTCSERRFVVDMVRSKFLRRNK